MDEFIEMSKVSSLKQFVIDIFSSWVVEGAFLVTTAVEDLDLLSFFPQLEMFC